MEHINFIAIVSVSGVLGGGVWFGWMQRELNRRRNESRMSQALRRGLAQPEGVARTRALPMLQWQSCESSAH
jgi:hypothetical protein